MDDPQVEAVDVVEPSVDDEAPVALVMVDADGADVCAADGTCW